MSRRCLLTLVFLTSMSTGYSQEMTIRVLELEAISLERLDQLNSDSRETNPCLTPDGKFLFFISGRGAQPWSNPEYTEYRGKIEADGDIYFSRREGGKWTVPVCLGPEINTGMGEDEPTVTPDGQFVIFQSWKDNWAQTGGPYYRSELSGDVWGKPVGLGGEITRFFIDETERNNGYFATDGSSLSPDGSLFIFACGKWYDKPLDLYMSHYTDEEWAYPEKLSVSTSKDERSVFIAADSRTIFFSSSGYGGFGGLDIFKTMISDDGTFSDIINVGEVLNSEADDYGFTMDMNAECIYFTRNADIYQLKLKEADKLLKPLPTLIIQGIVMDYDGNPLEANIRILHDPGMATVATAKSNATTGEYSIAFIKNEGFYRKEIRAEGFKPAISSMEIPDLKVNSSIKHTDLLKKLDTEYIFFDLDSANVRASETGKLDSINDYMFRNKRSRMYLSGHADTTGSDEYNLELSRHRVENIKAYFEDKGIPGWVMKTTYYGEKKPLKRYATEAELYLNRRVEIMIFPPE